MPAVCRLVLIVSLLVVAVPAQADEPALAVVTLPSDQQVTLLERRWEPQADPEETWVRFRYLAPSIGGDDPVGFEATVEDMLHLCRTEAIPAIVADGRVADLVIISLSQEPIAFGETNPDVTQYFEAYRVVEGDCIPEAF